MEKLPKCCQNEIRVSNNFHLSVITFSQYRKSCLFFYQRGLFVNALCFKNNLFFSYITFWAHFYVLLWIILDKLCDRHCVRSVRIRSYSGIHFPLFELNDSEYGHLGSENYSSSNSSSHDRY